MRFAILSAPACLIVTAPYANGEAFDGERVVRLPRRFSRGVHRFGVQSFGLRSALSAASRALGA